jgi:hypothetical protein
MRKTKMDPKPTKSDREWLAAQIMALPTTIEEPVQTKPGLPVDVDVYRETTNRLYSILQTRPASPLFVRAKARLQRDLQKLEEDWTELRKFEHRAAALATYEAAIRRAR